MARIVDESVSFLGLTEPLGQRLVFSEAERRALVRASEIVGGARALLREKFGQGVESWELDLDLAAIQHNASDLAADKIHLNTLAIR